jgi:tRNA(Ile)-lysidine synthase
LIDIAKLSTYSGNRTILSDFSGNSASIIPCWPIFRILSTAGPEAISIQVHTGFSRDRNELIITGMEAGPFITTVVSTEELNRIDGISAEIRNVDDGFLIPRDSKIAALDLDRIVFPLTVRRWQPGDFFYPLGMKERKKLSDYFIDRKYPVPDKEKKMIVESAGNIVCIIGDRIDDRFKITPGTKKALIIKTL